MQKMGKDKKSMEIQQNGNMLQVIGLNTFYGKAQVLFDLSFEIRQSEAAVLLGRNGAGKTTAFKSIMGILRPQGGKILYKGQSIESLPPHKICSLG